MNEPITIGTNTIPNILFNRLNSELKYLQEEGFPCNLDIDKIGEFTFIDCKLSGECKYYVASCLADIIIEEWENNTLKKIVQENYYYYNEEEKKVIFEKAKNILDPVNIESFRQKERKEKIIEKIIEYLNKHKELILEGFINFRLKEYHDELKEIVNNAVDDFMLEKEYMEFIRLLKYFVDIQEPRIDKIKIVFKKSGEFVLLDELDKPVKHECLDGLMLDLMDNEINYDDLLLSALITIAPREVELHKEEGVETGETIKTIKDVFGKKVKICEGCKRCRPKE